MGGVQVHGGARLQWAGSGSDPQGRWSLESHRAAIAAAVPCARWRVLTPVLVCRVCVGPVQLSHTASTCTSRRSSCRPSTTRSPCAERSRAKEGPSRSGHLHPAPAHRSRLRGSAPRASLSTIGSAICRHLHHHFAPLFVMGVRGLTSSRTRSDVAGTAGGLRDGQAGRAQVERAGR